VLCRLADDRSRFGHRAVEADGQCACIHSFASFAASDASPAEARWKSRSRCAENCVGLACVTLSGAAAAMVIHISPRTKSGSVPTPLACITARLAQASATPLLAALSCHLAAV